MKISRKIFEVRQLVENRNDYMVLEVLYVFGISAHYCWYGRDGLNGDIPFSVLSSAVSVREELSRKEEIDAPLRDDKIIADILAIIFLTLIFTL